MFNLTSNQPIHDRPLGPNRNVSSPTASARKRPGLTIALSRCIGALLLVATLISSTAAAENVLNVRMHFRTRTLDPAFNTLIPDRSIIMNIYSALLRYDNNGELVPDLAESWSVSEDGLRYTFSLRPSVKWHHGYGELTAQDVKYTFERVLDPETSSPNAAEYQLIDSIEVLSDLTVRFNLKAASSTFIHVLAAYYSGFIVNSRAVADAGGDLTQRPVGTGPFAVESVALDDRIVLTANEDYFLGKPGVDKVNFISMIDQSTADIAMERGEIDLQLMRTYESVERFENNSDLELARVASTDIRQLVMNTKLAPFDNPDVRRAMQYAVDREAIAAVVFEGFAEPLGGFVALPPQLKEFWGPEAYEYNPTKAREILAAAGYPNGFSADVWTIASEPWLTMVQVLQASLAESGIDLQIQAREIAALADARSSGKINMTTYGPAAPVDPEFYLFPLFHSINSAPVGRNYSFYSAVDDLLDQARATASEPVRADLYKQIADVIAKSPPSVPMVSLENVYAYRKQVVGFEPDVNVGFWLYPVHLE